MVSVHKSMNVYLNNFVLYSSYESGPNDDTQCDLLDLVDSENEEESWQDDIYHPSSQPLWVLPLYSLLPSYKQAKVFLIYSSLIYCGIDICVYYVFKIF